MTIQADSALVSPVEADLAAIRRNNAPLWPGRVMLSQQLQAQRIALITLRCTQVVRRRLRLAATRPNSAPPTTALGDWYIHLIRLGPQQVVMATSERSLVSVLLPARDLRRNLVVNLRIALEQFLDAIQVPPEVVRREIAEMAEFDFGNAVNRRVIGSMNELAYQLDAYVGQATTPLELALRLSDTPMSAVGSKTAYGIPKELARELLRDLRSASPSQH